MAKARLKKKIFKLCESVLLIGNNYTSSYGGFNNNPWVKCIANSRSTKVFINDKWWNIDPNDWEIIGADIPSFVFNVRSSRKYIKREY